MIEIGKSNQLQIVKQVDFGCYLDGESLGEILLPKRYVPEKAKMNDWLTAFIYRDSEDRLIATTEKPYAQIGECAYLKVLSVNRVGAFLDWGLPKDLLVPYNRQQKPMQEGVSYPVYLYLDPYTDRIVASSQFRRFFREKSDDFEAHQAVDLFICDQSEMGYKAVIDDSHLGLIFKNEVFRPLKMGQRLKGYIKNIRIDKKIDLSLQLGKRESSDPLMQKILQHLQSQNGLSTLTDKSPPEQIYQQFAVSKANYKRALGRLYKQKHIRIEKQHITLLREK